MPGAVLRHLPVESKPAAETRAYRQRSLVKARLCRDLARNPPIHRLQTTYSVRLACAVPINGLRFTASWRTERRPIRPSNVGNLSFTNQQDNTSIQNICYVVCVNVSACQRVSVFRLPELFRQCCGRSRGVARV